MARARALLFGLLVLLAVGSAAAQDDPFRKWLHNLTLSVPPLSKELKGDINVSLDSMVCGDIDFSKINSAYLPPLSLSLDLAGLRFSCKGHFSYASTLVPKLISGGGDIHVSLSEATSLAASLRLVEDQYGLASAAVLQDFDMSISISEVVVTGGVLEAIVTDFFKNELFKSWFSKQLDTTIKSLLTKLVDTNLTHALASIDDVIRPFVKPVEPAQPPPVPEGAMNLNNSHLIHFLERVLDDKLGPTGLNSLTDFILNKTSNKTGHTPGVLALHNLSHAVFGPIHLSTIGTITFGISDVVLGGLDSWSQFQLFVPSDNYTLDTLTTMDSLVLNLTFFLNVSVDGSSPLQGTNLYEQAEFYMNLAHNSMKIRTQLAVMEQTLASLQGTQFLDVGCLCSLIGNVNFTEVLLNTTVKGIRLIAKGGQSEQDLDAAIDNLITLFTRSFGAAIPAFLNGVIAGPLRSMVNDQLSSFITSKAPTCKPPHPSDMVDSITVVVPFSCGVVVFFLVSIFAAWFARREVNRSTSGEMKPLMGGSRGYTDPAFHEPALVIHPQIPARVRYGIIFCICMNISLFICSNTNVGASVYILLTSGGESVRLPDLFQFTLANSVRDMWHAKVYPLSLLIAIFSGGWPYAKLLLMLLCWIAPTNYLRVKSRETTFMVVDMLGKWSLIDSFVMVLMLVAFRFHVGSKPGEAADVFVEPGLAIYTFVGATMLSLFISHLCLYYHRRITPLDQILNVPSHDAEALKDHHFVSGTRLVRCTRLGKAMLPLALMFALASLIGGAIVDAWEFVFQGAAGWALSVLGTDPSTSYSLISLGKNMPYSSSDPDAFGVRFLQCTFFAFALGMPLAHMLSATLLWLYPLTLRAQNRLFVIVEAFNAWAALDVFVLTILACLLEIRQFAAFIVGDNCDAINGVITQVLGKFLDGDNVCFDVVTKLSHGCYVLFGGAVVWLVCSVVVMRTCHSAIHERKMAASRAASAINYMDCEDSKESSRCCNSVSLLSVYLGCVQGETMV
jgi:hypothetical protein